MCWSMRTAAPHLDEEAVKTLFIRALNSFCRERAEITAAFEEMKETAFQTDELDREKKHLQEEMKRQRALSLRQCVSES